MCIVYMAYKAISSQAPECVFASRVIQSTCGLHLVLALVLHYMLSLRYCMCFLCKAAWYLGNPRDP